MYIEALRSLRALFGRIAAEEGGLYVEAVDPSLPTFDEDEEKVGMLDVDQFLKLSTFKEAPQKAI